MYENFGKGWIPCKPPTGTGSYMKKQRYFEGDEDPLSKLMDITPADPRLEGLTQIKEKKTRKKYKRKGEIVYTPMAPAPAETPAAEAPVAPAAAEAPTKSQPDPVGDIPEGSIVS